MWKKDSKFACVRRAPQDNNNSQAFVTADTKASELYKNARARLCGKGARGH